MGGSILLGKIPGRKYRRLFFRLSKAYSVGFGPINL
jgi:hypothetical protein